MILLSVLGSCKKSAVGTHPDATAALNELENPSAFRLLAAPSGATLAWSPKDRREGALLTLALGKDGTPLGKPASLVTEADGNVEDLVGCYIGTELALAWIERSGGQGRVRIARQRAGAAATSAELGAVELSSAVPGGNLAMATGTGTPMLLARGKVSACVESGEMNCAGFGFFRLEKDKTTPSGFPLSVPAPCERGAIFLATTRESLHYGVCSARDHEPRTTLFTIQTEPAYARADPALAGCTPLTLSARGASVWFVADCAGKRRAARVGSDNTELELMDLASPRVECRQSHAHIRAGALDLELAAPEGNLEAFLPSTVAPRGSRAVWSGEALVVGQTSAGRLSLSRYACRDDAFRELERRERLSL